MSEIDEMLPEASRGSRRERKIHPVSHLWRSVLVRCLLVLSCLGMTFSTLFLWMETYPLTTSRWLEIATPLGQDPQVVSALSTYVSTSLVDSLQVQKRLAKLLPGGNDSASSLSESLRKYLDKQLLRYFQSDSFQTLWVKLNRTTHIQMLAALRGDSRYLDVAGDTVTLDLLPVIIGALTSINQHLPALFARPVADLPENATPVQERQALADALNVSLPANFGQITLFHLRRLPLIQATVGLSDALVNILPLITLALLIMTLIFSTNRRRSLIGFGLGVSLGMLLLYIATRLTLWYSTNIIQTVAARPFVGYMLDAASQSLLVFALVLAGAGLLMAAIVFQIGRAPRLPDLSDDPEPRE